MSEADPAEEELREERDLILRAQAGDQEAFRWLVERYQRPAFAWARERLRNSEDAMDVAQEAFVRVFRNLDKFDADRRFSTWLYRIVANLSIDVMRRRRSRRMVSGLEDLPDVVSEKEETYLEREVRKDSVEEVYICLDRLPPKYREMLVLRDIEGIPATEIAGILGLTHPTVRWRLHQARKLFREVWERVIVCAETEEEPTAEESPRSAS